MPMTSELETLHAKGGHFGNGHLTSRGIAALHTLYIHRHINLKQFTLRDKQSHDINMKASHPVQTQSAGPTSPPQCPQEGL